MTSDRPFFRPTWAAALWLASSHESQMLGKTVIRTPLLSIASKVEASQPKARQPPLWPLP